MVLTVLCDGMPLLTRYDDFVYESVLVRQPRVPSVNDAHLYSAQVYRAHGVCFGIGSWRASKNSLVLTFPDCLKYAICLHDHRFLDRC